MRNTLVIRVIGVLLCCGGLAQAGSITFTNSGTISGTENYDVVNVQNDGTVLQIFGGTVGWLNAYDTSRVEMHGGAINRTISFFFSDGSFLMDGGVINGDITSSNNGGAGMTIDINGGILNLSHGYIKTPEATINIRGGVTPLGGDFGIYVDGYGGEVNIYGYGFAWNASASLLSGYLADNNPFVFRMDMETYGKTDLHVVPEPLSLGLLGLGGLFLRRTCKK